MLFWNARTRAHTRKKQKQMTLIKHVRLKSFCEKNSSRTFYGLQSNWRLLLFWSALFSFAFHSLFFTPCHRGFRSDRQKFTIEKFRIAKLSFVIGDQFIDWLARHSLVQFAFFPVSLISHIFELPVGFYWHRSSICVQDWLSLHHTFSLFYNNVLLPSSSLFFPWCLSLNPQPFVVHR